MWEEPACDLCGSRESASLYRDEAWKGQAPAPAALVRCRRCGLIYLCPRPSPDDIGAYYPPDYAPFRPAIEDERWGVMRWMRRRKLIQRRRWIERYSGRREGRVLDVGCATGLFLREMALSGWEAVGVELTEAAARYARTRFGLKVHTGMLGDAPLEPRSFDAITFWDVLEHTFSPSTELARAAQLLKPGGLIAINIPNWNSLERKLFGPCWIGLDPPRHLYVFTRATLETMLEQAGFEPPAWVCFMPGYFAFVMSLERWLNVRSPAWAKRVSRLLNLPGARLIFEPGFTLLNGLKRGNLVSAFARKRAEE